MSRHTEWLFEVPMAAETTQYTHPYINPEYYVIPEWETEWELPEAFPLNEEEWEMAGRRKVPSRPAPQRPLLRQIPRGGRAILPPRRAAPSQRVQKPRAVPQRPGMQPAQLSQPQRSGAIGRPPANRNSRDYIRWVQSALNQILGLNLTVDGIIGTQTVAAIRNFQRQRGLTVDGKVGRETERALMGKKADATIDQFDFDSSKLKPFHLPLIDQVAKNIAQSWEKGQPIMTVWLIGHTDPVGTPNYNMGLGSRRAMAVLNQLKRSLENQKKGLSYKVLILVESKGERQPIEPAPTEEARAKNRRVEMFLSTEKLLPIKPKIKEEVKPDPNSPCDWEKINRAYRECYQKYLAEFEKCKEDMNFITNGIKNASSIMGCGTLPPPVAIACLVGMGYAAADDLAREYYRVQKCFEDAELKLSECRTRAVEDFCETDYAKKRRLKRRKEN